MTATGGRKVLLPLGLAAFITALDGTVVTVAAPSIRADLGLSFSALEWVAAIYLLAFGGLMLVGGRLTDLLGRRRVMQVGLWLFAAASALVALAPGAGVLLVGRGLQGAAAALVVPAAFALVAADLGEADRHTGVAVYTAAIGAALALGPVVGGAISQFLHWSFIFWINIPVIALTSWCTARAVPGQTSLQLPRREWLARLDLPGLVTSTVALCALTFALVEGHALGFGSVTVLGAFGLALAGVVATVVAEGRVRYPMFDVDLVRNRMIAGSFVCQLLWGLGLNGVMFFTSLFLQDVLGLPPAGAGLVFVPLALAVGLTVPFVGRLVGWWGQHRVIAIGMAMVAFGLLAVGMVGRGDAVWQVLPGVIVIGVGSALVTPMGSAPLDVLPMSRVGVVSALLSVAREIAGVLGIAVTGAVVAFRQSVAVEAGAPPVEGFLSGYRTGLVLGAVLALVGAVIALYTLYPGQQLLRDLETDGEADLPARTGMLAADDLLSEELAAVRAFPTTGPDLVIDLRDGIGDTPRPQHLRPGA